MAKVGGERSLGLEFMRPWSQRTPASQGSNKRHDPSSQLFENWNRRTWTGMSQRLGGAARRWGLGWLLHGRGGLRRGQRQLGIPSLAPGEASVEVTSGHL